ncbi:MAG: hypothetical protein KGL18_17040 [Burkholderiales bacterium]|nr:hypothetical protein [Burkholderiales bacterium]MDE1927077.1 hypothetical protein [Burkholderiales bacterium]MDE2160139.1 hypothetical protein [Burkholderiales bacterium]MDE2504673.1 hypothetical protein [Burkholderiales bacterium]
MSQQTSVRNPFQMMIDPELVLAAVARSERLGQLQRRLCRPLDRVSGTGAAADALDAGDLADASDAGDGDEPGADLN